MRIALLQYTAMKNAYKLTRIVGTGLGLFWIGMLGPIPLYSQQVGYARGVKGINQRVDEWVEGEVVFRSGESKQCTFSYNPLVPEGLLKIAEEDRTLTGTVFSVERFSFYDQKTGRTHTYFSLPIDQRQRIFAELWYDDAQYSILGRKLAWVEKQYWNTSPVTRTYIQSRVKTWYRQMVLDKKHQETYLLTSKNLIHHMKDKRKEIKQFIKTSKFTFENINDYIAILKEYQRLTQTKP